MFASARAEGSGVRFTDPDGADLELRFPRPGQVSVGWSDSLDAHSYAVLDAAAAQPPSCRPTADGWRVDGPGIAVEVGKSGCLTYRDDEGRIRRTDSAPRWQDQRWVLATRVPPGSGVHGMGGRSFWDLRGRTVRCWNTDPGGAWRPGTDPMYNTSPAYVALDDVGAVHCFIDNAHDGTVSVDGDTVEASFVGGPVRWHVAIGSLADVIGAFTALTGRPTPPPRWSLGHHQARWGYGSSAAIREVWSKFREHDLPLSAMHLDIDHMDRFRDFTFGQDWADIAELVAAMSDDGVRTVVIVDAGIARADDFGVYREGMEQDVFCRSRDGGVFQGRVWPGPTVFPDFTAPRARDWWGRQFGFYDALGIAGYWHDMNEPACFGEQGVATFPLDTRHDLDGHPADHAAAHNLYGYLMCRASYEGLARLHPQRRPFLFSRSGWVGLQRYGGHWSGDIEAGWPSLLATIHQAFAFGVCGIGYYGPDIGGFTGDPSPELFTRWFQLASFLPFFRTHCAFSSPRREPWEWGEPVMGRLRAALQRRYRLLPYWYTLALAATADGAPYVRPLAWEDPALRAQDDAFLVGDDVLVAPVLQEGATTRRVLLPAGVWFHAETGQSHSGEVWLPVGPEDIPWFVRAGAVVPTEEDGRLVLLVAPPAGPRPAAGGRLLTDAGDGWEPPHHEQYRTALVDGLVEVTREIRRTGVFPFAEEVEVRTVDGRPARLV